MKCPTPCIKATSFPLNNSLLSSLKPSCTWIAPCFFSIHGLLASINDPQTSNSSTNNSDTSLRAKLTRTQSHNLHTSNTETQIDSETVSSLKPWFKSLIRIRRQPSFFIIHRLLRASIAPSLLNIHGIFDLSGLQTSTLLPSTSIIQVSSSANVCSKSPSSLFEYRSRIVSTEVSHSPEAYKNPLDPPPRTSILPHQTSYFDSTPGLFEHTILDLRPSPNLQLSKPNINKRHRIQLTSTKSPAQHFERTTRSRFTE